MPTARFNLRNPSGDSPQSINLVFRFQNERLKYATAFAVLPKYWSDEKQRVKNVTSVPNKDEINNHLNDLKTEIERIYSAMVANRERVTVEALRNHLDIFTGKAKAPAKDFFGFVRAFIENAPGRILPETGKKINARTVQKYRTTLKRLEAFAKQYRRKVDFETIDFAFYEAFVNFLKKRNDSTNTIGKHIKTLKTFLNAATLKGVNSNLAFRSPQFKAIAEESDNVYLNEGELTKIFNLDLSENPRLERVRDLFLVGWWTGLRFSDFTQIKPENVKADVIDITQQKTGRKVIIPIHPVVKTMLDKYAGRLPGAISNQKMNDYIKEVCQLAGIDEKQATGITKGGARVVSYIEKYQLVSTHTARRSFATNLFKSGFPAISIMQITGHRTEKAFLKYIKATPDEHAKLLKLHWKGEGKKSALKVV